MAISVRGTPTTGPNNSATSTSISLPSGVTTGDVSFICFNQARNGFGGSNSTFTVANPVMTPPSGWTALYNSGAVLVCYRAFVGGDPTTGITATSTVSDWWESACVAYSGLDTASPIDASAFCCMLNSADTFTVVHRTYRAPSLNPNYAGSRLLCIFAACVSSGAAISLPSGLTSRATTSSGPDILMADKSLTDGTPTGNFDATATPFQSSGLRFGMQIALKASGAAGTTVAAASPALCGLYNVVYSDATPYAFSLPLDRLSVQDGDIVAFIASGAEAIATAPTGFTQRAGNLGAILYTKTWNTGDSQTPTFNFDGLSITHYHAVEVAILRKTGVDAQILRFDDAVSGTASGTTSVAVTAGTLTPKNASEILLVAFGNTSSTGGTWSSVTGGLTVEETLNAGPSLYFGWAQPAASPTGTFSATWAQSGGTYSVGAFAALFYIGAAVVPGGTRPVVFVCT